MEVKIVDTTLRDGEQTPGVLFSLEEKLDIARQLNEAGVHYIEAGTPANGPAECHAIQQIIGLGLTSEIITWNRALKSDIDRSLSIGSKYIHISLPVSDIMIQTKLKRSRRWVLGKLREAADYLRKRQVNFSVGAEDATRAARGFLTQYVKTAEACGADRVRICDTVGVSDPFSVAKLIKRLSKKVSVDLEIHAHNDLGMATANALAAAKSGAAIVNTTVIGLGERAGNTPLEEIIMALKLNLKVDTGVNPCLMKRLAHTVSLASKHPISNGKSIVGEGIFTHESGIHVDGVRKNPMTYEPFQPELVGATRRFIIGKHSGPKAVSMKLKELGYATGSHPWLIDQIRDMAALQKGGLSDEQLMATIDDAFSMTSSRYSVS